MRRGIPRNLALIVGGGVVLVLCMIADLISLETPWPFIVFSVVAGVTVAATQLGSIAWSLVAAGATIATTIGLRVTTGGLYIFSLTEAAALLLLFGVRWRYANSGRDLAVVGVVAVAGLSLPLQLRGNPSLGVAAAALSLFVVAAIAGAVRRLDERRAQAVAQTRANERTSMSRELHDLVAHHITGVVVTAQAAQLDDDADRMRASLAAIEHAGGEALAAARRLVATLREDGSTQAVPQASLDDIIQLIDRFSEAAAVGRVDIDVAPVVADAAVLTAVHRVIQESLTNIRRYAYGAEHAIVRLQHDGSDLVLMIANSEGATIAETPALPRRHLGITGMTERIEDLGGTLTAGPTADGWCVLATFPRR
jgi:signal transduction histidine kinase